MTMPHAIIRSAISMLMLTFVVPVPAQDDAREVVAYFPEWVVHLQEYWVRHIAESPDATELTVLNYSFVIPGPNAQGDVVLPTG